MPRIDSKIHTFIDRAEPDDTPGDYYVSCVDGGRFAFLAGPFRNDHKAALEMVPKAREVACELDPRAHFYGIGTCRRKPDPTRLLTVGILNARLGLPESGV